MSTSSPGLSKTSGSSEKLKTSQIRRWISQVSFFKIWSCVSIHFVYALIRCFLFVCSIPLRGQKSSTVVLGNWASLQMARATWTSSDNSSARLVRACTWCSYHNTRMLLFIALVCCWEQFALQSQLITSNRLKAKKYTRVPVKTISILFYYIVRDMIYTLASCRLG